MGPITKGQTVVLTVITMGAFAANSLLCRMALSPQRIDPVSFTSIRVLSGAATLWLLHRGVSGGGKLASHGWISPAALYAYAIAFSLAYVSLDAGTGALILFGMVQVTMIGVGLLSGERPHPGQWIGLAMASGGLVYLLFPGATAPSLRGGFLMAIAGVAWGVYSLRGRAVANPIALTTVNFVRATPLALAGSFAAIWMFDMTPHGAVLATTSGALTSGLGYVLWYRTLRGHSATSAAIAQLSVPIIAAFGGVALLEEILTMRLVLAGAVTLCGVSIAILSRQS